MVGVWKDAKNRKLMEDSHISDLHRYTSRDYMNVKQCNSKTSIEKKKKRNIDKQ